MCGVLSCARRTSQRGGPNLPAHGTHTRFRLASHHLPSFVTSGAPKRHDHRRFPCFPPSLSEVPRTQEKLHTRSPIHSSTQSSSIGNPECNQPAKKNKELQSCWYLPRNKNEPAMPVHLALTMLVRQTGGVVRHSSSSAKGLPLKNAERRGRRSNCGSLLPEKETPKRPRRGDLPDGELRTKPETMRTAATREKICRLRRPPRSHDMYEPTSTLNCKPCSQQLHALHTLLKRTEMRMRMRMMR